jgi:steroid delta-isomerase-like uncharacterized protein
VFNENNEPRIINNYPEKMKGIRTMTTELNRAALARFVDFINNGDATIIEEVVHPDFVELDPMPGQEPGPEGLKGIILYIRSAFPDIEWKVIEDIAEGDRLASRFVWTGTHLGNFLGIPASGNKVTMYGMVFDKLVDGKMLESRILMDIMQLLTQLGAIPAPAKA